MSRFNRSEITKNAWVLFRSTCKTFSDAMKQAWAKAKIALTTMTQKTIALGKVVYNVLFENELGFIGQDTKYPDDVQVLVKSEKAINGYRPAGEMIDSEIANDAKLFRQNAGCYLFSINPVGYNNEASEAARTAVLSVVK